jgi:YggT family protein
MAVIRTLLNIYIIMLILDSILSFIPQFKTEEWRIKLKQMTDYTCDPIRKKLPPIHIPIDPAPLIVIILIQIFKFLW